MSNDEEDYTAEVQEQECEWCGRTPTQAASESGERLCGPHGSAAQLAGQDVAWDEDASQLYELAEGPWTVAGVWYKDEMVPVIVTPGTHQSYVSYGHSPDSFEEAEDMHESWLVHVQAPTAAEAERKALNGEYDDDLNPETFTRSLS